MIPATKDMFSSMAAWWSYATVSLTRNEKAAPWREQYRALRAYYLNNGLYELLYRMLAAVEGKEAAMRPLRNPAFRVVEFYAAKLWPGTLPEALPIEFPKQKENPELKAAIEQLWQWSNWNVEKQTCARWFANYGDMFIKVAAKGQPVDRVFMQNIEPEHVTDFDADERGYLTYVRMDIPRTRRGDDGKLQAYTHTEVWTKENYRLWEHDKGDATPIDQLGKPTEESPLTAFGIDFVPVVWVPFRSIGDERGVGAFTLQLDKIDEVNRQATRLSQMLYRYNKALWLALANDKDTAGRPLPAPRVGGPSPEPGRMGKLEVEDDAVIGMPGYSSLQSLVPAINYRDALGVLQAQESELEADLPELAYYRLRDKGDLSGRAIRSLLGDAIDRLNEARGNGEAGIIRAQQMGLTMGAAANLEKFRDIGTYANGDFEHKFAERDPFPLGDNERAETAKMMTDGGFPLITAARFAGFSESELVQLQKDMEEQQRQTAMLNQAYINDAETRANRIAGEGREE